MYTIVRTDPPAIKTILAANLNPAEVYFLWDADWGWVKGLSP